MRESARSGTFARCLTAAKTAAMTIVSYRHEPTGLEYRASRRTFLDRCGRSAHAYGSEGWGFESLRARPGQQPIAILQRPLLLPMQPSSCPERLIDRVGRLLAEHWQHVRVGVHRHADPGVAEHFHDRP